MESLNGEVRKVKVYLIVERRVSKNFAVDFIWPKWRWRLRTILIARHINA
jgi:hypothetical protein